MEIEAKFSVPNRDTMERLKRIVRLGPFEPGDVVKHLVVDTYYDTAGRDLLALGYAYRVRQLDDQRMVTLKGIGDTDSAIHRRTECEVPVSPDGDLQDMSAWPSGDVWDSARSVVGEKSLQALFVITQSRHVRELYYRGTPVAALSIDEVLIEAEQRKQRAWIVEAELEPDGTIQDLESLVSHLEGTWGLVSETVTKFHMGLALADEQVFGGDTDLGRLSSTERAQLEHIVEATTDDRIKKRALLLLGWTEHQSVRQLASELGGSKSWAYGWIERFRQDRMSIFPERLTAALLSQISSAASDDLPKQQVPVSPPQSVGETVDELLSRFEVDEVHARRVRDHALELFDATAQIHRLGPDHRRLLEYASLLHAVGLGIGPAQHHVTGRDLLLANRLVGVNAMEQRMLAGIVYLHRKQIKRRRLESETIQSLPVTAREDTLRIAALLRLADALDSTQRQTSELAGIEATLDGICVSVVGPMAQHDAASAQGRTDLWNRLFDIPIVFVSPDDTGREETDRSPDRRSVFAQDWQNVKLSKRPGIVADELMSEAGRKTLRFHFQRMLAHEQGTRDGEDAEELHDMRVATRRMRSAFRVFAPYYRRRAIRPLVAGLRRTARTLGAVRDLDVLIGKAHSYLETLPLDRGQDLDPLLAMWCSERDLARDKMLAYLGSPKFADFKDLFWHFLEGTIANAKSQTEFPPRPQYVQHVVPVLIYSRWARVQAFGPLLVESDLSALHALRIECKRLRYSLEFFVEVLGPEAGDVISEVVCLQDHLGDLNDADVANAMLSRFLFSTADKAQPSIIAPGVVSYLAYRQRELESLVTEFPPVWMHFCRAETKRLLANALAVL